MYNKKYSELVAHENDDIYKAYWNFSKTGTITLVCDENDKFVGVICKSDWDNALRKIGGNYTTVSEITNRNCTVLSDTNPYEQARSIYAEKNMLYLPVIDSERNIVDLFSRRRAFYMQHFKNSDLPYMNYAKIVWASAFQAKQLGYKAVSVIEFGVAGGNGLLALQFHAREFSRLLGIEIQVYGFDCGEGLPQYEENYLNMMFQWEMGQYKMDFSRLQEKLDGTQLILGNIDDTVQNFVKEYNPAPIGGIMVDVDLYSSAVSTLKVLDTEYENVLPRVHMYFDDIFRGYECIGENIALKEFNEQHKGKICISPEGTESSFFWTDNGWHVPNNIFVMDRNIKLCHYFRHPKYNQFIKSPVRDLPLSMLDI